MWWTNLLYVLLGVLIGAVAGFFISRKLFADQLKKNPPINENMIRAMYRQMGQKPSEKQIRQVINAMNKNR
ncbi:MAG: YneF family protein [Bacilli bacterium]|nr:YneF family protein [Bacilli bacterium]